VIRHRAPPIFATTTTRSRTASPGNVTTTIFTPLAPVFQVADVDITVGRGPLPFQPFPFRGTKSPPLDLSNPAAAIGVFSYVSVVGNNGPANGATNNDGSPSGEVNYTFMAPSVFSPLIGLASPIVTGAGNAFASLSSTIPPSGRSHTQAGHREGQLVGRRGHRAPALTPVRHARAHLRGPWWTLRAPGANASITFDAGSRRQRGLVTGS
jgi:hypothetical protein